MSADRSGAYGTRGEWVRFYAAQVLAEPLWQVKRLGDRADLLCARVLWWGERPSPERSEHLAWHRRRFAKTDRGASDA